MLLMRDVAPGRGGMARLKHSPVIHWVYWAMWVNKPRIMHVHVRVNGRTSKVKTWEVEK